MKIEPTAERLQQWANKGRELHQSHERHAWAFSEWAAEADTFPKMGSHRLKGFCDQHFSASYDSAKKAAKVWKQVKRVDGLSFSHHLEVYTLPPDRQQFYLKRAVEEKLSPSKLRAAIRTGEAKPGKNAMESDGPCLKLPSNDLDTFGRWLERQPKTFFTPEIKNFWKAKLSRLVQLLD